MGVKARVRYVRVSPRKARLVVDMIRGKRIEMAMNILLLTQKKSAGIVLKLLKSAMANAGQDQGVDVDTLMIKEAFVDQGPTIKRFMPRARGRATRVRKRTSHITLILEES